MEAKSNRATFAGAWSEAPEREQQCLLESGVSAGGKLVLGAAKLLSGLLLQAPCLMALGLHALADAVFSLALIIGGKTSQKPPDAEHPFGHARIKHVLTLCLSVLLGVFAVQIGLVTLLASAAVPPPLVSQSMLLMLGAMVVAELSLAVFARARARYGAAERMQRRSRLHGGDALLTALAALVLWGRNHDLLWADPLLALVLVLGMIWLAWRRAQGAVSPLLGESAPLAQLERVLALVKGVEGVENAHDLRMQRYGDFYFTTIHVELSDQMDVHKMHELTVKLEMYILREFPGECVVHVDPINLDHPLFNRLVEVLRKAVIRHPDLVEFHDLVLWNKEQQDGGQSRGDVEVSVQPHVPEHQYAALSCYVLHQVEQHFPELHLDVRLKVDFSAASLNT